MKNDGEPSIEDILASIRKVLTREKRTAAGNQPHEMETDLSEAETISFETETDEDGESILILGETSEVVEADPANENPAAENGKLIADEFNTPADDMDTAEQNSTPGENIITEDDDEDLVDHEILSELGLSGTMADPQESNIPGAAASSGNGLMAADTAQSLREKLAALAIVANPGAGLTFTPQGESTLDTVAQTILRPMLAEWLDANLPDIVERLVEAEIARIVGRKP